MVRLDDTSGLNPVQETLSGGSFDWKPDAIDIELDGMGNGDMHVPVDGLKVVVSVDTSLNGGVGSDGVVEDSYNEGDTASYSIKLGWSGDWKGDGSGGEQWSNLIIVFLLEILCGVKLEVNHGGQDKCFTQMMHQNVPKDTSSLVVILWPSSGMGLLRGICLCSWFLLQKISKRTIL